MLLMYMGVFNVYLYLFVDPGAESAGHNNSRAAVPGSVCRDWDGAQLQPGQCV